MGRELAAGCVWVWGGGGGGEVGGGVRGGLGRRGIEYPLLC